MEILTVPVDILVDGQRFTSDQRLDWISNVKYFLSNIQGSAEENTSFGLRPLVPLEVRGWGQ